MPLPRKAQWDRVRGLWLRAFLSSRVRCTRGRSATRPAAVSVLFGQAADVYARTIQGKAPFRMVLFTKHGVAQSVLVN